MVEENRVVPPWKKPKIVAILSIFGGKIISVVNVTDPIVRRANNETFYR